VTNETYLVFFARLDREAVRVVEECGKGSPGELLALRASCIEMACRVLGQNPPDRQRMIALRGEVARRRGELGIP
jgi:hypothetical protein